MTADEPWTQLSFADVGGKVRSGAPLYAKALAGKVDAGGQRRTIEALLAMCDLTSKEISEVLVGEWGHVPATRTNQIGARLGELFERDAAAPVRDRGACTFAECRIHVPPRHRHRPTDACEIHGEIVTRDGAAVWRLKET